MVIGSGEFGTDLKQRAWKLRGRKRHCADWHQISHAKIEVSGCREEMACKCEV